MLADKARDSYIKDADRWNARRFRGVNDCKGASIVSKPLIWFLYVLMIRELRCYTIYNVYDVYSVYDVINCLQKFAGQLARILELV